MSRPQKHPRMDRVPAVLVVLLLALLGAGVACVDSSGDAFDATAVRVSGPGCRTDVIGQGLRLGPHITLTSGHVVDGVTEVQLTLPVESPERTQVARVVHLDRVLDVAILASNDADTAEAELLDDVIEQFAMSFVTQDAGDVGTVLLRGKDGQLISEGYRVVRRIQATTDNVGRTAEVLRPSLEVDAAMGQGDSGAILHAEDGTFAGSLWAISRNRPRVAYAVQGEALLAVLADSAQNPSGPTPC